MGDSKLIFDERIPADDEFRKEINESIVKFVDDSNIQPPVTMATLRNLAEKFISGNGLEQRTTDWVMVFINNALWRETVAAIPHERRVLLMPQCLKDSVKCKAPFDDFGLLCQCCGSCPIYSLETMANDMGMMTIISEGFSTVVSLIESGQIEAVVGVACLESLEKVFPLLVDHAIPGIAIPLTKAGCVDTSVDSDMVKDAIALKRENIVHNVDFEAVRKEVDGWFKNGALSVHLCPSNGKVGEIARDWLAGEGNRWRPSLLAATYKAVSGDENFPEKVRIAAIAVESFHKASLVHDDIEDNDDFRYGKETLHKKYGVAAAINIGDLLLGQGYALLMKDVFNDNEKAEFTKIAAKAHCDLCAGQGLDLEWSARPEELNIDTVMEIAKYKTVPAFRVAFEYGGMIGGANDKLIDLLREYSEYLGLAYQLKDDIEDSEYPEALIMEIKEKLDFFRDSTMRIVDKVENNQLRQLLFRLSNRILGE
jgi:hypothetical protein